MPDIEERLRRLEDAAVSIIQYVTDGQPQRATRSLAAGSHGVSLVEFISTVQAERERS